MQHTVHHKQASTNTQHCPPIEIFQAKMVAVSEFRKAQRAEGSATVLAIGTTTPPNCFDQSTYPDFYFRITKNEEKTELKEKFKRICKFVEFYL